MKYWALALGLVCFCTASGAFAYTNLSGFSAASKYYTGSPRYTETCASCHKATNDVFDIDSGGMTASVNAWMYEPGQTYTITVTLNEVNASNTSARYQNGFVLEILNSSNQPAGILSTGTMTQLSSSPTGIVLDADSGASSVVKQWSFNWTAPAAGSGPLKLWFAGVDGDGDLGGSNDLEDITDAGSLTLMEETVAPTPSGGCGIIKNLRGKNIVTFFVLAFLFVVSVCGLVLYAITCRTDEGP